MFRKGGKLQIRNFAPKETSTATSATEGYSRKCLASSTRKHWETCCGSSDDNTRNRYLGYQGIPPEESQQDDEKSRKQNMENLCMQLCLIRRNQNMCVILCEMSEVSNCAKSRYFKEAIVCCNRGVCFVSSEEARSLNKEEYDVLRSPLFTVKKGANRRAQYGRTEDQHAHHLKPKKH